MTRKYKTPIVTIYIGPAPAGSSFGHKLALYHNSKPFMGVSLGGGIIPKHIDEVPPDTQNSWRIWAAAYLGIGEVYRVRLEVLNAGGATV